MSTSLHAGSGETSPTRIAEIEARVNAASAGPWIGQNYVGAGVEVRGHMPRSEHAEYTLRESDTALLFSAPWHQFGAAKVLPQYLANAEFAANARQDIPWLIDQLRAASDREAALLAAWKAYATESTADDGHTKDCLLNETDCDCGWNAVEAAIEKMANVSALSSDEQTNE